MKITRIERGENLTLARLPVSVLRAGDRIYVSDTPENLKEFEDDARDEALRRRETRRRSTTSIRSRRPSSSSRSSS